MKTKINSRSSNDVAWQNLKKACRERDKYECRLCNCLTALEYKKSKDVCKSPSMMIPSDVAHVEAVGYAPTMTYQLSNVFFFYVDFTILALIT